MADCSIDGCNRQVGTRGWCNAHYGRWYRHGDPLAGGPPVMRWEPLEERFWAKVDRSAGPEGCWPWTAFVDRYGRFEDEGAHRVSYKINVGPIPDDLHVLHRCDNPPCVNPAHLFLGTEGDNAADKVAKGRSTRGDRNSQTKLTPEAVRAARASSPSTPLSVLAERHGVSKSTMWRAVNGTTWSWVR